MADLSFKGTTPANINGDGDDLLSILNRETQEALRRIAEQLNLPDEPRSGPEASSKYRLVCQAYEARRERTHFFDADLFGDPAWDILLAMFREHLAGRTATMDDAIEAAGVPPSTAARWLGILEGRGLILRRPDHDRVELTTAAVDTFEAYLERLRTKALMRIV